MGQSDALIRAVVLELLREGKGVHSEVVDWCRRNGIPVKLSGGGHLKVLIPGGALVVAPSTPGDHRGELNFRAKVRREINALIAKGLWPANKPPP